MSDYADNPVAHVLLTNLVNRELTPNLFCSSQCFMIIDDDISAIAKNHACLYARYIVMT